VRLLVSPTPSDVTGTGCSDNRLLSLSHLIHTGSLMTRSTEPEHRRSRRALDLELLLLLLGLLRGLHSLLLTLSHFAALLAIRDGGCRICAVGDRPAPQLVYTSARKKTVTRRFCVRNSHIGVVSKRNRTAKTTRIASYFARLSLHRKRECANSKNIDEISIIRAPQTRAVSSNDKKFHAFRSVWIVRRRHRNGLRYAVKNFTRNYPRKAVDMPESIKNERIGCW
jgi:hypothetical protein